MRTHDFKVLMEMNKHRIAWKLVTNELTRKHFTKKQWEKFKKEFNLVKGI